MKNKNWLITGLLTAALACGSLALASCSFGDLGVHTHTYGEWTMLTDEEKVCDERLYFRTCNDCGDILWKQGSYDDHDWDVVTTQPTCEEQGYDTKTCQICDKVEITNYTSALGHAWASEYTVDNSYHWYDCGTCDDIKDKAEHTADNEWVSTICQAPIGATEGVLYRLSTDKTYAEVIGYEGTATRVKIADTYEGVPVTGICQQAFYQNENITQVIIGGNVTTIVDWAFAGRSNLRSVVIPDSVTTIGNGAFASCSNLTDIYITDIAAWCHIDGLDNLMGYGSSTKNLYLNNELITDLIIPNSVTTIWNYAFNHYTNLTSVVIGDSVTTIGDFAFGDCTNLTSVVIPDSVTTIGNGAFYDCEKLTSVVIPDSVTTIGGSAFSVCYKLSNITVGVNNTHYKDIDGNLYTKDGSTLIQYAIGKTAASFTIPDSVTTIGYYAFARCSNLTSVVIGDSVTTVGYYAFQFCSNLTSVVIGDSVTTIGDMAFMRCTNLTSVVIPDSVTWIGDSAFYDCTNLTTVYYQGTASDWEEIEIGWVNSELTNAKRYYYSEERPTKNGNYWHYDENGNPVAW